MTLLTACGKKGPDLKDETVMAACGTCVFDMPDVAGCQWAVEIKDSYYLVQSAYLPDDHDSHAPDGMCMMPREAKVTGSLHGDRFVADAFELLPLEGAPAPSTPSKSHDDHAH